MTKAWEKALCDALGEGHRRPVGGAVSQKTGVPAARILAVNGAVALFMGRIL